MAAIAEDLSETLSDVNRRLYTLEQLQSTGGGGSSGSGNSFPDLYITDPSGGNPIHISYTSFPPTDIDVTVGALFDNIYADVSWTAPTGDVVGYSYELEWAKKVSGTYQLVDAKGGLGGNTYRVNRLEPNSTYGFRVTSVNPAGKRSTSFPASGFEDHSTGTDLTLPAAPTGMTVLSTVKSLIARINRNSERDVDNGYGMYRFELATDSAFTSIIKTNIEGGVVSYFPDLEVHTQYWIRAWAIDSSGNQSTAPSATGTATTSAVVGSDTSMLPSGSNWVKNSIFIRQEAVAGFPDYWTLGSGSVSLTQGLHTVSLGGLQGGQGLQIAAASPGDYHAYQDFNLPKGFWVIGCKINRISVATASGGQGSGMNLATTSGIVAFVRDFTTTSPGTGSAHAPSMIFLGSNAIRWEWVVVEVTSAAAVLRVYLQQGFGGTCTGTTIFGEIQVEQGDTPTAWHGIPSQIVTADEVYAGSMNTGVFTANTLNGDRLLANSAVIEKLGTGTLSVTTSMTVAGAILVGSPPTTGLLFNSQGIRLYSGGVAQVILDVGGTASFKGTINADAGYLGALDVNGILTINGSGYIRTASSGTRIELASLGGNEVSFYSGSGTETNRGFLRVETGGGLSLQAPTLSGTSTGQILMIVNSLSLGVGGTDMVIDTASVSLFKDLNLNGAFLYSSGWTHSPAPRIKMKSGNLFATNWTGSQLDFYVDNSNVKTFVIDHPSDKSRYLVHGTLEGPEAGVYYRGEGKLKNGWCKVELPKYFESLCQKQGRSVQLTCIADDARDESCPVLHATYPKNGKFHVGLGSGSRVADQRFWWEVKAIRKNAKLNIEPKKSEVTVRGDGPYTYYEAA